MTMEYTGPPNEWLEKVIADLKLYLAKLSYSESTILRLDATWKELVIYCNVHRPTEFTVDLEREFVWERYGADLAIEIYLRMSAGPSICWMTIYSMEWSLSNQHLKEFREGSALEMPYSVTQSVKSGTPL